MPSIHPCSRSPRRSASNARPSQRVVHRAATRFSEAMRNLYYDTVLYSKDSLELLFKTVGVDRCLFGTERPGVGTVLDPRTGRWLDETRYTIEAIDWLTDADKKMIFEDNAKKVFNLKVAQPAAV